LKHRFGVVTQRIWCAAAIKARGKTGGKGRGPITDGYGRRRGATRHPARASGRATTPFKPAVRGVMKAGK
jgi:hypothetical protein